MASRHWKIKKPRPKDGWGFRKVFLKRLERLVDEFFKLHDISGEVADKEALILNKTAEIYTKKFSLSNDQAMKIARNVTDFQALQDRDESDIADFAQKLYGVNPSEIVSAVANAQVGNNEEMNAVIEQAAQNFNTNKETMKAIVNELHGRALEANGIQL
jgi:hypothetical protein